MPFEEGSRFGPIRRRNIARLGIGLGKGIEIDTERSGAIRLYRRMKSGTAKGGESRKVVVFAPTRKVAEGLYA